MIGDRLRGRRASTGASDDHLARGCACTAGQCPLQFDDPLASRAAVVVGEAQPFGSRHACAEVSRRGWSPARTTDDARVRVTRHDIRDPARISRGVVDDDDFERRCALRLERVEARRE
jgi:hypothetical protein